MGPRGFYIKLLLICCIFITPATAAPKIVKCWWLDKIECLSRRHTCVYIHTSLFSGFCYDKELYKGMEGISGNNTHKCEQALKSITELTKLEKKIDELLDEIKILRMEMANNQTMDWIRELLGEALLVVIVLIYYRKEVMSRLRGAFLLFNPTKNGDGLKPSSSARFNY